MELHAAKLELFEHFADVGRAVGSGPRLLLLDLLAQGEKTVEMLARQAGLTVGNTSAHLKGLRHVSLVSLRKVSAHVYYRLASQRVHEFVRSLQSLTVEQLAGAREIIDDHFHDPDVVEPVNSGHLLDRLRAREVIVLDVRPPDEYAAAHIPGSISMPFGQIEQRLDELPRGAEVVVYCRGPYCIYAVRAVEMLKKLGFRARRLDDGIPDWTLRGLPVAVGAPVGGTATGTAGAPLGGTATGTAGTTTNSN
jgi:rhodanese-related sulfurtransferase/DNA-binding transcriptional ArsR family regulator